MTSICPNCQQPVRTGAKFCGYCGTSLVTSTSAETVKSPIIQKGAGIGTATKKNKTSGAAPGKANRVVTSIAIVLLFLVILLSIVIRHWPDVSPWISQILPGLNIP